MVVIRRFWSVIFGSKAIRVSAYDDHGMEHYCMLPDTGDRFERKSRREHAAEMVEKHVMENRDPGFVGIRMDS